MGVGSSPIFPVHMKQEFFQVTVVTNSKKNLIFLDNKFIICVTVKAENNMANKEMISSLFKYFNEQHVSIKIINGHHRPRKTVSVIFHEQ